MIFVTVGTTHFPFDRLIRAVSLLQPGDEELVVQRGASDVDVPGATVADFMRYEEVDSYARRARVIVSHAGVGSIMTALAAGHHPIVVPRLARYGEAVDDHQAEIGSALAAQSRVVLATDVHLLPALVTSHAPPDAKEGLAHGPLVEVVADEVRKALEPRG